MLDQLSDLVEKAELAVASSAGVISDDLLDPLIEQMKTIRVRMSYPDDVLVVALAGGTGSGKSSLFNALAEAELADVGGVRPTTSEPAAAVPRGFESQLDGLLDHIGVSDRHTHDGPPLCLIDLPDTDSVEVEHRQRVDRLLPLVDVVVWVIDPEKYRDARLHHDYLAPLSYYSDQFVVVLNQADRLSPAELERVQADLRSALAEDGLSNPMLLSVAAAPAAGPPIGIAELVTTLAAMQAARDVVAAKLVTDLATTARTLSTEARASVDFDARARAAVSDASASLEEGDTGAAVSRLTSFLDDLAAEVGGPTGRALARVAADVPGHVTRIASDLSSPPKPRWWFLRQRKEPFDRERAAGLLGEAVVRPARAVLAKRAVALASIADLAMEIESLRRSSSR